MPTYESQQDDLLPSYGLHRLDHAVGNAPKMGPVLQYLGQMTGWHEFAEFTAEDVGTLDSGDILQKVFNAHYPGFVLLSSMLCMNDCAA